MDKTEIGLRLREFLIGKFGKLNIAADYLGIGPQNLNKYLKGKYVPGGELISKLIESGCDIAWLFDLKVPEDSGIVSDGKAEYGVKDKVIINQAEEIYELRTKIEELNKDLEILKKQVDNIDKIL